MRTLLPRAAAAASASSRAANSPAGPAPITTTSFATEVCTSSSGWLSASPGEPALLSRTSAAQKAAADTSSAESGCCLGPARSLRAPHVRRPSRLTSTTYENVGLFPRRASTLLRATRHVAASGGAFAPRRAWSAHSNSSETPYSSFPGSFSGETSTPKMRHAATSLGTAPFPPLLPEWPLPPRPPPRLCLRPPCRRRPSRRAPVPAPALPAAQRGGARAVGNAPAAPSIARDSRARALPLPPAAPPRWQRGCGPALHPRDRRRQQQRRARRSRSTCVCRGFREPRLDRPSNPGLKA